MDESIYEGVKNYSVKNGISIAGAISVLCNYAISTMESINMMGQLMQNKQFIEYSKNVSNQDSEFRVNAVADPSANRDTERS